MRDLVSRLTFSWVLVAIELLFILAASFLIWRARNRPIKTTTFERWLSAFARRRTAACVSIGLLVLVVRAALIPVIGIPQPRWDDEYSYILSGQTFAMGRLTNPTPPMWKHFETFHEIMRPTYSSMYPPAQGLFLAVGIVIGKNPWIGVLIANALMCAAACWMLQGWLPPGWALYGAFLFTMRLSILSYWMNTYFSGAVPALGGALVLGALPRLRERLSVANSLFLAIGLEILANSRPYEGFVLSIPVAAFLLFPLIRTGRPTFALTLRRFLLPVGLTLILCGLGMAYYFYRVTGDPFKMPYQVNRAAYAVAPYFIWQKLRPDPLIDHPVMRDYVRWEREDFAETQTLRGLAIRTIKKIPGIWAFYIGLIFTIPLLWLHRVFRNRKMGVALWILAFVFAGTLVETWTFPHYIAPSACLFYLVLTQCIRQMRLWTWQGIAVGARAVLTIPVLCISLLVIRALAAQMHVAIEPPWPRGNLARVQTVKELTNTSGDHLVIVREKLPWLPSDGNDWVFNGPDIDHERIVWARDMGDLQNRELLDYFKGRSFWFLDNTNSPPELAPYQDSTMPTTSR